MVNDAEPAIIYSDDEILAIDKPAGMPSVSLKEHDDDTLASWIIAFDPEQKEIGPNGSLEAGLIHRLDNDTSGLILAARTQQSYDILRGMVASGSIQKIYLALVLGHAPDKGDIDLPIAHHPRKKKKMVVCESKGKAGERKAREARTHFEMIKRYRLNSAEYSLLSISISTGVRHQIRAHLASQGYPIAGDGLYQNARKREDDILDLSRHLLHSHRMVFAHPRDGHKVELVSEICGEFAQTLSRLTPSRPDSEG